MFTCPDVVFLFTDTNLDRVALAIIEIDIEHILAFSHRFGAEIEAVLITDRIITEEIVGSRGCGGNGFIDTVDYGSADFCVGQAGHGAGNKVAVGILELEFDWNCAAKFENARSVTVDRLEEAANVAQLS